jgi:ribonuclease P protein component
VLAKSHRLRTAADIARVYKKGVYGSAGGVLSVKAVRSGRLTARAVVVVGKKVSKRAVVRNRIRRRLTGLLFSEWATVRTGYDIVISVHSDVSELSTDELRERLFEALGRAAVITT